MLRLLLQTTFGGLPSGEAFILVLAFFLATRYDISVGQLTDITNGVCVVIRLRRVGREYAICDAIRRLEAEGKYKMFTKGEICRKMGIKSTSRIRDILNEMVACSQLVGATTAIDGYGDEVAIYGLVRYEQTPLPPDHEITINGVSCRMSDMEVAGV